MIIHGLLKLLMLGTRMIAYHHGDTKDIHYSLDLYLINSNYTVRSIMKLLWHLELPKVSSPSQIFKKSSSYPLFATLHEGKERCMDTLGISLDLTEHFQLPLMLYVQLDNCWKDTRLILFSCFGLSWSLVEFF